MILQELYTAYIDSVSKKQAAIPTADLRLLKDLNSGHLSKTKTYVIKQVVHISQGIDLDKLQDSLTDAANKVKTEMSLPQYIKQGKVSVETNSLDPNEIIVYAQTSLINKDYEKALAIREKDNTLNMQNSDHNMAIGSFKIAYVNEKTKMLELLHKHGLFMESTPFNNSQDKEIETLYNLLSKA